MRTFSIVKKFRIVLLNISLLVVVADAQVFIPFSSWQKIECNTLQTQVYNSAGTFTLAIPIGCSKMNVYTWGGGGGGGNGTGAGTAGNAGAGGYASVKRILVSMPAKLWTSLSEVAESAELLVALFPVVAAQVRQSVEVRS